MIAPLTPFAIRGAIWYQGESNVPRPTCYVTLMKTLVRSWRHAWGQGDFGIYQVQLANYLTRPDVPTNSPWASLRAAQHRVLEEPHTGLAVAIDIGEAADIHPTNKQEVGRRLAAAALHQTYGQRDIVPSGPAVRRVERQGNELRLHFDQVDGGLELRGDCAHAFAVCGEEGAWVWADARLEGEDIVVGSAGLTNPVAVRYAWADNPPAPLYNRAGLPAIPFEARVAEN